VKSLSCDEWVFPKWAWSGSRDQFLHYGLRKFRHSKSSVYRWYTQLDRCRLVYDTWDNGSRLGCVMVVCTVSITHCLRLNLQLHTINFVRTCRISSFCTIAWQLARFHWHDASCGPSAIAELLVKMAAVRHLGFWKFKFLTIWAVKRPILHNPAKFHEDRSIRCCDITFLWFFKMAAAAISVFEKFEILMVCPLYGANLCHRAKFHQNQSNGCWDMAI